MADITPILSLRQVTKSFSGITVLQDIKLDLRPGEVHCIVGENGAGKSTLIKIISGAYQPDHGDIKYAGEILKQVTPRWARENGINTIYQEIDLIPVLNAAENIYLGNEPTKKGGNIDWKEVYRNASKVLNDMGADLDITIPVQNLKVAQQQMVAIAKALSLKSKVLILDEPTAVFTGSEIEILFKIVGKLKEQGIAIVYISHHLDEIFEIGDTVTILRDGQLVKTGKVTDFDKNSLVKAMVGREIDFSLKNSSDKLGQVVLSVEDLSSRDVKDISFELHKGEVLGIAGLVGAGRTEMARLLIGADPKSSGTIKLNGQVISKLNPTNAMSLGIGMLPESRKEEGLVLSRSMTENMSFSKIQKTSKFGFVPWKNIKEETTKLIRTLNIRPDNSNIQVMYMSGGNQQKVVLAKLLAAKCDVLILDEPTRGVDVGARLEIYKLIMELKAEGKAILMVSSDLPEILTQADRILVMCKGRIVGELMSEEATEEKVLKLALQLDGVA